MDVVVPTAEIAGAFIGAAARRPGFDLPVAALDDPDKIHQFAAVQRVMDDVAAGVNPVG